MSKVEEFGFDASAFLIGTQMMNHAEVGQYIRILATMSINGRMTEAEVIELFGEVLPKVRTKFKIDIKKKIYNVRLEKEMKKALERMQKPQMTEEESQDLKECKECYFKWFEEKTSMPPKIFGADINALKSLIAHFRKVITQKKLDAKPVDSLQMIFDNWGMLDQVLQQQTKLIQINSNINNIINQLKNGGIKRKSSKIDSYRDTAEQVKRMLSDRKPEANKPV